MLEKYRPSGRLSLMIFALLPALLAAGVGVAWLYQLLIELVPFVYLDALLVIGFGASIGYGTFAAVKAGKCRNKAVAVGCGLMTGLVAIGASHYFAYWHAVGNQQGVPVSDYLHARTQAGWKLGRHGSGLPVSGLFVYLVWCVEGLGVMLAGAIGGLEGAGRPFCEICGVWADKIVVRRSVRSPGAAGVESVKSADNVAALLDPTPGADAGGALGKDELVYTVRACPGCDDVSTLSVASTRVVLKGKKKEESRTDTLHAHLLLSKEEAGMVRELVEGMGGAEPMPNLPGSIERR